MENVQIRILPEADDFLTSLADVLVREGYKPNFVRAAYGRFAYKRDDGVCIVPVGCLKN